MRVPAAPLKVRKLLLLLLGVMSCASAFSQMDTGDDIRLHYRSGRCRHSRSRDHFDKRRHGYPHHAIVEWVRFICLY